MMTDNLRRGIPQFAPALVAIALATMLPAGRALGDFITIDNHSFEATALNPGDSTTTILGWDRLGPGSVLDPVEDQFSDGNTTDGENLLVMGAAGTIVHQDLVPTLAYGVYLLTFDVGNRLDAAQPPLGLSLLADGTILNDDFTIIPTPGEGLFLQASAQWTVLPTNANGTVGFGDNVRLRFLVSSGVGGSTTIDNVRLQFTAAIPEPGFGLPLTVLCAALTIARKRWLGLAMPLA